MALYLTKVYHTWYSKYNAMRTYMSPSRVTVRRGCSPHPAPPAPHARMRSCAAKGALREGPADGCADFRRTQKKGKAPAGTHSRATPLRGREDRCRQVREGRDLDMSGMFHMDVSVASRTNGASSVAGAAYVARSRMRDGRTGVTYDYRRCHRHEVLVADLGVTLPAKAPTRWRDRARLWDEVEATERCSHSQLCRRVEVALPRELDRDARLALARRIVASYTGQGMVVDACVHDATDGHNPHLHMQMPMRACDEEGFLPKSENEYLVRDDAGDESWMSATELADASARDPSWSKVHRYAKGTERRELTDAEAASWAGSRRASKAPVQRTRYLVDWNDRDKVEQWRAATAGLCNDALEKAGATGRVDHRSYARQGVDRLPPSTRALPSPRSRRVRARVPRPEGRPTRPSRPGMPRTTASDGSTRQQTPYCGSFLLLSRRSSSRPCVGAADRARHRRRQGSSAPRRA